MMVVVVVIVVALEGQEEGGVLNTSSLGIDSGVAPH